MCWPGTIVTPGGEPMDLACFRYEGGRALIASARIAADLTRHAVRNPANPAAYAPHARSIAAGCEMFERVTRRDGKPRIGLDAGSRELPTGSGAQRRPRR